MSKQVLYVLCFWIGYYKNWKTLNIILKNLTACCFTAWTKPLYFLNLYVIKKLTHRTKCILRNTCKSPIANYDTAIFLFIRTQTFPAWSWPPVSLENILGLTSKLPFVYVWRYCSVLATSLLRKNVLCLQVLVIEPTKVYQPAYVSINSEADESSLSLWHVSPPEMVKVSASLLNVLINFTERNFLHVDFGALYNNFKFATFLWSPSLSISSADAKVDILQRK